MGYGNPTDVLPKLAESYQEAKMALEVGRLFYVEKEIMAYDRLGIGRLIYQLPMSLCEMFIREVLVTRCHRYLMMRRQCLQSPSSSRTI